LLTLILGNSVADTYSIDNYLLTKGLRNYRWSESYNRLSARYGIANEYMQQRLKGIDMKLKENSKGFTLVELMIVVAIVAILVALALPSYTRYVRKANRGEAQQLLLNWANNQEIWRANDTDYATSIELAVPTHTKYTFYKRVTAGTCATDTAVSGTQYSLVACPIGDQANDKDRGVDCDPLTLDQANDKTPPECW
jgi:type IV pilus assembly protein PilE